MSANKKLRVAVYSRTRKKILQVDESDIHIPLISTNSSPSCIPARAAGLSSTQETTTCIVHRQQKPNYVDFQTLVHQHA